MYFRNNEKSPERYENPVFVGNICNNDTNAHKPKDESIKNGWYILKRKEIGHV